MRCETLVLGADDAAQAAALAAASAGQRVALVILPIPDWNGLLAPETPATLTVSDALRRLIAGRPVGLPSARRQHANPLREKLVRIARDESETAVQHLAWNGVEVFVGGAEFVDSRTVAVTTSCMSVQIAAGSIIVASGTRSHRPGYVPFDGRRVIAAEDVLRLETLPASMIVVGGGTIGLSTAAAMSLYGTRVELFDDGAADRDPEDEEIRERAAALGVRLREAEEVIGIDCDRAEVRAHLASGERVSAPLAAWCTGRVGATDDLNLPATGIETDECGRLWCDSESRTWLPGVRGVGSVVGFRSVRVDIPEPREEEGAHASTRPARRSRRQFAS